MELMGKRPYIELLGAAIYLEDVPNHEFTSIGAKRGSNGDGYRRSG
jgi:hypothetical protein